MRRFTWLAAALLAISAGCGSSGGSGGSGGSAGTGGPSGNGGSGGSGGTAGTGGEGGSGGSGGSGGQGGEGGSGGTGGQGDGLSCATAFPLTLGKFAGGQIDTAGKRVYYTAAVKGGDFLAIATQANPNNHPATLDTAVSIFDATGATRLASVDDNYPRVSSDSAFTYHSASDQTLCFLVEEWSTWAGKTPVARPGDNYKFTVSRVDPSAAGVTMDTEPNDSPATAQTGQLGTTGAVPNVFGTLSKTTDVDVYEFTGSAGGTDLHVEMPPLSVPVDTGVNGYGSTLRGIAVIVADQNDSVLASLDPAITGFDASIDSLDVPVTAGGKYVVTILRPNGGTAGANDFYATSVYFSGDSPSESGSPNDTQVSAEAITLSASPGDPKTQQGYILGTLSPAGTDVDWFSFPANAGDKLVLACAAQRGGSGLRDATFEIWSATSSLQSQTETPTSGVLWNDTPAASKPPIAVDTSGIYYLKVSAGSQDSNVTGNYYRCGVYVTAP